jgi:hypothetical protein
VRSSLPPGIATLPGSQNELMRIEGLGWTGSLAHMADAARSSQIRCRTTGTSDAWRGQDIEDCQTEEADIADPNTQQGKQGNNHVDREPE